MKKYVCIDCFDGEGGYSPIYASSAKEAAQIFVEGGDWGESDATFWVKVCVKGEAEEDLVKVAVHPQCPPCRSENHEWEDTGIVASGGGVKYQEKCLKCGLKKTTDTWGQDHADGEQGLYSISYDYSDE